MGQCGARPYSRCGLSRGKESGGVVGGAGPHCTLGLALCSLDSVCYSGTKSLPVSANSVVAVACGLCRQGEPSVTWPLSPQGSLSALGGRGIFLLAGHH